MQTPDDVLTPPRLPADTHFEMSLSLSGVLKELTAQGQGSLLGLLLLLVIVVFTSSSGTSTSGQAKKAKKRVQGVIDRNDYVGIVLTEAEVALHNSESSAWLVVDGRVHDVTNYVKYHPGGREKILKYAGGEATKAFRGEQHPDSAADVLAEYYIGDLVAAGAGAGAE